MIEKEIYKDIPNYEGIYQVSNFGNIKSFKFGKEKQRKLSVDKRGYLNISLTNDKKEIKPYKVHVLVAITFLNFKPNGICDIVVDHKNEIKADNRSCNLQIITQRENVQKHKKIGKNFIGVTFHPQTKKWRSRIYINRKNIHLGLFIDKKISEKIYKIAVENIKLFEGDVKEFKNKINKLL